MNNSVVKEELIMDKEKRKLLVTGASGFLGSRVIRYYSKDYEIFAPSHNEMDITDKESVEQYFRKIMPDYVVNCAAISNVQTCEEQPERSKAINVDACIEMARLCHEINAKCVLCSSDQVYFGSTIREPHTEEELVIPANTYGIQKRYMEQECLKVNPDVIMLRLTWMYDAGPTIVAVHPDFITNLFRDLALQKKIPYLVYDKRGITDVNEVVHNIEKMFSLPGGIYNFGAYNDKSDYETVRDAFLQAGYDIAYLVPNKEAFADQPRNLCMNMDKLEKAGITFQTTVNGIVKALKDKKAKDGAVE